jgi:hypothetical protein
MHLVERRAQLHTLEEAKRKAAEAKVASDAGDAPKACALQAEVNVALLSALGVLLEHTP